MEKLKYKTYSWDKEFEIKGYFSDDKTNLMSRGIEVLYFYRIRFGRL